MRCLFFASYNSILYLQDDRLMNKHAKYFQDSFCFEKYVAPAVWNVPSRKTIFRIAVKMAVN